jgi:hypothetical protein
VDAFATFVAFLGFEAERRRGPRVQSGQADRLAGLLAIAVGAVLDAAQGLVDLGDQLPLAIAGAKLKRPISFRGRAIGEIGVILGFFLEMGDRLARFAEDLIFPGQQLCLKYSS